MVTQFKATVSHINPSIKGFFLAEVLAYCAIPLANFSLLMGWTPFLLTSFSFLLSLIAAYLLAFTDSTYLYILSWTFSVLFDFADGIVARVTQKTSAIGSFYDKYTDLIKLMVLPAACIVRYSDSNLIIVLCVAAIILTNLGEHACWYNKDRSKIYNEQYAQRCQFQSDKSKDKENISNEHCTNSGLRRKVKKILIALFLYKIAILMRGLYCKYIYNSFFVPYGNIFIYYVFFGTSSDGTVVALVLYNFAFVLFLKNQLLACIKINNKIDLHKFRWK